MNKLIISRGSNSNSLLKIALIASIMTILSIEKKTLTFNIKNFCIYNTLELHIKYKTLIFFD